MRSLSREEVRDVDRRAIEDFEIPGIVLMENAGRSAAETLLSLGVGGLVIICAGHGNNGGDGFVIARHLQIQGVQTRIILCCDPAKIAGDAAINYRIATRAGLSIDRAGTLEGQDSLANVLAGADWIVDALLGTGLTGRVREPQQSVIQAINDSGSRVLAVDLPSGLDCDTGQPLGCCVRAHHTVTFVAHKLGFAAPNVDEWTGEVTVAGIGVPPALLHQYD